MFAGTTVLILLSLVPNFLIYKAMHFPSLSSRSHLAPTMDSWAEDASGMPWLQQLLQRVCLASTDGKCCCFFLIDHCPKHLRPQYKSQKRAKLLFPQLWYFLPHLNFFRSYHAVLQALCGSCVGLSQQACSVTGVAAGTCSKQFSSNIVKCRFLQA